MQRKGCCFQSKICSFWRISKILIELTQFNWVKYFQIFLIEWKNSGLKEFGPNFKFQRIFLSMSVYVCTYYNIFDLIVFFLSYFYANWHIMLSNKIQGALWKINASDEWLNHESAWDLNSHIDMSPSQGRAFLSNSTTNVVVFISRMWYCT